MAKRPREGGQRFQTRRQAAIIKYTGQVSIMTKVNIISGFLGAGKTTLIKKLLDGAFGSPS